MTQSRGKDKLDRVKPGAILRAAGVTGDKAEMPNFTDSTPPLPPEVVHQESSHAARLEVMRNGDHIQKIIAHCQCGEQIVIDCDYGVSSDFVAQTHPPAT